MFFLILACAPELDATADRSLRKLTDGTPQALGMIELLNDGGTTFEVLDDQVGLDARAAQSLSDFGTFRDVQDIDDCYFVGPAALDALEVYAAANDWIATDDDDRLGEWDDVEFTMGEAEGIVELVNTSGRAYLDDEVGLDSRAVDSILDARTIGTVLELSELYYVGTSALTKLKDAAEGEESCDTPGWDTEYVYDEGDDAWRTDLPSGLVAVIDETLETDDWCGEATGSPTFVKATVDRFDCEAKGYTIELGQGMLEYPEIDWYIEFEVDGDFDWFISTCEV
ncbi:MAG: hypothetical protein GY913_01805 [Proteobacteria bacterium]|nr:hypothetical protein [Pseudomonadota bacterium]MCP4915635.1 hypothetical protein [Pseudomonadota bacterium]